MPPIAETTASQVALELLTQGQPVRLRATGGSMRPWLRPGRVVTITPLAPDAPLRVGDVAFVTTQGRPALHRVIQTNPGLMTKGDALGLPDLPPIIVYGRADAPSLPLLAHLSRRLGPWQHRLQIWRLRLFPPRTAD